jgi:hypothetical protein
MASELGSVICTLCGVSLQKQPGVALSVPTCVSLKKSANVVELQSTSRRSNVTAIAGSPGSCALAARGNKERQLIESTAHASAKDRAG